MRIADPPPVTKKLNRIRRVAPDESDMRANGVGARWLGGKCTASRAPEGIGPLRTILYENGEGSLGTDGKWWHKRRQSYWRQVIGSVPGSCRCHGDCAVVRVPNHSSGRNDYRRRWWALKSAHDSTNIRLDHPVHVAAIPHDLNLYTNARNWLAVTVGSGETETVVRLLIVPVGVDEKDVRSDSNLIGRSDRQNTRDGDQVTDVVAIAVKYILCAT